MGLDVHHDEVCCLVEENIPAPLFTAPVIFGVFGELCAPDFILRRECQKKRVALHLDLEIALNRVWAFEGHATLCETHSQLVRNDVVHVSAVHNLPLVAFVIRGKHHSVRKKGSENTETVRKPPFSEQRIEID